MTSINSQFTLLDLDRNHLHRVRNAYLALNQTRLALAKESLSQSQQLFVDTLPALIHFNHPMLPGYITRTTPAGLYDFHPSETILLQLQKLARSFHSNRSKHQGTDILALYSMGSLGTIAHNDKSDIDIWLCYRPDLDTKALVELEKKCRKISRWAKTLHLDVTIFLMNNTTFQSNHKLSFDQESSGSTQHYLLLDEFYRTALHLGGQLPTWIFVRPEQEAIYSDISTQLQKQRLLPEKHLIDFGAIKQVPSGEFIGAAIWQLYKAIDSPYKSILKLLVLEIYCRDLKNTPLLSTLFKKQLHGINQQGTLNLWEADPYLQTYTLIEQYLENNHQQERLEFLRRCFYFKLENPLTGGHSINRKSSVLLEMVKHWGWDIDYIEHLDNHNNWSLNTILEERKLIINELNHSYHLVMDFFRLEKSQMHASNRELNILGRKLHAAFSRKAGKIDWVNPLFSRQITESKIVINATADNLLWQAKNTKNMSITKKNSLIELLTWLHCNQIITQTSRLFYEKESKESLTLKTLHRHISTLIPTPLKTAPHKVFEEGCYLKKMVFFINQEKGMSARDKSEKNVVHSDNNPVSVDCITINSWNEIICTHKDGLLIEMVLEIYVDALQREISHFNPTVQCFHPTPKIQKKLDTEIGDLIKGINDFFNRVRNGRYVMRVGQCFCIIHINEQQTYINWLKSEHQLKQHLSKPTTQYNVIEFDKKTMGQHPLTLFADYYKPNSVQVFYCPRGNEADITLIDEMGTWYETTVDYMKGLSSLQLFHRFLRAVTDRRYDRPITDIGPLDILSINFYEMINTKNGWYAQPALINSQPNANHTAIPLYAITERVNNEYQFLIYCNDILFSEPADGQHCYQQLASYLRTKKIAKNHSVFAITDIDLSHCRLQLSASGELHTAHYLHMKELLETKIQRALRST